MERGSKDIMALSLPLASGVASGALLPSSSFMPALSASLLGAVLLGGLVRRPGNYYYYIVLYFLLGLFLGTGAASFPAEVHAGGIFAGTREWICRRIEGLGFGNPLSAPLVEALSLGERGSLSREVTAVFRGSGTSHILAMSGLHLGIFYLCLSRLLWPFGRSIAARRVKSVAIILLAGFYVLLAGASASLTRAFLFIFLREWASMLGRRTGLVRTLFSALMIQLILSPSEILSPGFQMSYLALCGIAFLYPRLEALYPDEGGADPMRYIWKAACLTISCQVLTAPIAWLHFGSVPLNFLLSNIVALPMATLLTVLSMLVALLVAVAGCCPQPLLQAVDFLSGALVSFLKLIAS